MTKAQADALLNHWNKFEIPLQGIIDPQSLFYAINPKKVIFEIGSGMGKQLQKSPQLIRKMVMWR